MNYLGRHITLFSKALVLILFCAILLFLFHSNTYAVPATQQLNDARQEATQARKKLDEIAVNLELATEDYEDAKNKVQATKADIFDANNELTKAESDLSDIQFKLNQRAEAVYRGDDTNMLDVILGAEDFSDLVTRLDMFQRIAHEDNTLLYELRAIKTKIQTNKTRLETKRQEQEKAQRVCEQKKSKAEALFAEQDVYMRSLDKKVKNLIATERKQIADEERRAARAQQGSNEGSNSSGIVSGARSFDPSRLGTAHPEAANIAQQYVGKTPYVWGGTSPSGFDCSGLTQYCYQKIGISIPRTSRNQYRVGAYIPANRTDLLQPGDLLFFGYNRNASQIHHVAIYAGGGRMIHAPQTGMNVSIAYLSSRSDYVGAVRP